MKKYYKHSIKNILKLRNIITLEYLELPIDYLFPTEEHNFWELVYIDRGSIEYFIDNNRMFMKKDDLFFLSPGQKHAIKGTAQQCSNIFVICFDCSSPLLNILRNYKTCLKNNEKGILTKLLEEAKNTFELPMREKANYIKNPQLGGEQMISLYLELFLITILRKISDKKDEHPFFIVDNIASEICNEVIKELEARVYEKLNVSDLCDELHYSKSYISRIFKEQTGKSMVTYYNELKITEAKRLIRETSFNMTQISDMLNFSDPRYFNFVFKNIAHMTPALYRQSINKSE